MSDRWPIVAIALVLTVIAVIANERRDPLAVLINEKFPPISINQQRQAAIDSAADALSKMPTPNVVLSAFLPDAAIALNTNELLQQGIKELDLTGDKQLVRIRATFRRTFTEKDAHDNEDVRKVLAETQPEVAGVVEAYAGLAGTLVSDGVPIPELRLHLLPGLSRVTVDKVRLANKWDETKLAEVLASILNRYRDNVTGEVARKDFVNMTIPLASPKPFDVTQAIKVTSAGTNAIVDIKAEPIKVPVKLGGVAWLVDGANLVALVQLDMLDATPQTPLKVEKTFEAIGGQVSGLIQTNFDIRNPEGSTWAAVRKELIAFVINSAASQAKACIAASGGTHQKISAKIPMPDGDGISCNSNRDCQSKRVCAWSANHDTRNCFGCLMFAPKICVGGSIFGPGGCTGGQCIQQGNNPICESAKAAQNVIYNTDANIRKADCDRLSAMETAGCLAEEAAKKGLCETGKAALIALHNTGNFANIDMESDLKTSDLRTCLHDFNLSPGLDHIALNLDVTGKAGADLDIKFVPLDIVGHLACQFPWSEKQHFDAELRDTRLGFNSAVNIVAVGEKPHVDFALDKVTIKARLSPSPTEFLLKSPNKTLACAGLDLLTPLMIDLTPFVPALRGDIDHDIDKQNASVNLPLASPIIGNASMSLSASETANALVLTATVKPKASQSASAERK